MMQFIGTLALLLARGFQWSAELCSECAHFFYGLLPVLLPPARLTALVKAYYRKVYRTRIAPPVLNTPDYDLNTWETVLLSRYGIRSGTLLILGSGWGLEAAASASRGLTVVGMDADPGAVRLSTRLARAHGLPAHFHQADFLALPYVPESFEAIVVPGNMYSATPGTARRRSWLSQLGRLLKPDGLLILSFIPEGARSSRLRAALVRLNTLLARLPGTNHGYQPGDRCQWGHFQHAFQDEEELRTELTGAGAIVRELDWARCYAILGFPPRDRHLDSRETGA